MPPKLSSRHASWALRAALVVGLIFVTGFLLSHPVPRPSRSQSPLASSSLPSARSSVRPRAASAAGKLALNSSLLLMPAGEVAALQTVLARLIAAHGPLTYLEYGSGGSTTELTRFARVAVSVEHDAGWCKALGRRLADEGVGHVRQVCVPRNGRAVKNDMHGDYREYSNYVDAVDRPGLPSSYDFVYVDGRARLGAALKVLPYLTDDSIVVVHDACRKRYAGVDKYYETVQSVMQWARPNKNGSGKDGLKIMRRRRDLPAGTWPLSSADINRAYADIPKEDRRS